MKEYDLEAHLSEGDVSVDSIVDTTVVQVGIKPSKTDPFRKGVMVYLERTGKTLCPLAAVTAYLAVRGGRSRPLFLAGSRHALSREMLVKRVREALQSFGVEIGRYSGHSCSNNGCCCGS